MFHFVDVERIKKNLDLFCLSKYALKKVRICHEKIKSTIFIGVKTIFLLSSHYNTYFTKLQVHFYPLFNSK